MHNNLDDALKYESRGFSVIPVRLNKKPFIPWTEFQTRRATPEEIKQWWAKWPGAMIGIVTGPVSGVCAIDIDRYADDYDETVELEYFPETLVTPTITTPRGGTHLYFKNPIDSDITVNARALPGIDFRGQGGYIIAPPSMNGNGKGYQWADGLSIFDVPLAELPHAYITNTNYKHKGGSSESYDELWKATENYGNHEELFTQGRRDEDLFHAANCLIKGGMQEEIARNILQRLALSCNPPFDARDTQIKIDSSISRVTRRERNLSDEIRDWVKTTEGYFQTTEIHAELRLTTPEEKKACYSMLLRLAERGEIEKHGQRRGCFRVVDSSCEDIDFLNAGDAVVNVSWPFHLEKLVEIMPGNIIIVAGEPNAGKTAFLLNLARLNMHKYPVYYFSSEMGSREMRKRLSKFNLPLSDWKIHAKERTSNFADVVKPDAINIIDFLEVYDEFYRIGGMIREVYDKLKTGIAVIAIQKNKNVEYGLGGTRGLEKARLYVAMEQNRARILKAKNWATDQNPNGMTVDFKLIDGCRFTHGEWRHA